MILAVPPFNLREMFGKMGPLEVLLLNGMELYNAYQVGMQLGFSSLALLKLLSKMGKSHCILVTNNMKVKAAGSGSSNIRKMKSSGEYFLKGAGVFRLMLTSDTPEAVAFQDWAYLEVLPCIHIAGSYGTGSLKEQVFLLSYLADQK
jgi:prophage antirepressor-like protein